ncbi:RTA1 like protein [Polyplosphaeria fusca]|uniref:RTA1 like protein n=1 Tax=Polyplosphaeria fusca TaxID=682080 RepID=A0A9P4UY96_9PLEO|nr:RTA1 like protein [Polyplosphaeria fusca]
MQSLLLLLAPALFAASIYMVLGRIILLTDGEKFSLIRRTWLTKIFVGGDVLSFLLQSTGGALLSTADDKPDNLKLGENVIMGGLFAQIVFFGFFVVVAIIFQTRGRAHLETLEVPWYKHLVVLYVTSTLILIRSIFRVVEYIQGNDGYLMRMEVFLYVFDALLMFKVMLAMNVIHPGDIAPMLKQKEANSKGQAVEMDRQSPV